MGFINHFDDDMPSHCFHEGNIDVESETISLTNISRLDLTLPDGRGKVRYSAECEYHLMKLDYVTNGDERKHLTVEEWTEKATELFKEKIRQDSL
jgi:hypothetical protein